MRHSAYEASQNIVPVGSHHSREEIGNWNRARIGGLLLLLNGLHFLNTQVEVGSGRKIGAQESLLAKSKDHWRSRSKAM